MASIHAVVHLVAWIHIQLKAKAHLRILRVRNSILHLLSDVFVLIIVAEFLVQFRVRLLVHWPWLRLCLLLPLQLFAPAERMGEGCLGDAHLLFLFFFVHQVLVFALLVLREQQLVLLSVGQPVLQDICVAHICRLLNNFNLSREII